MPRPRTWTDDDLREAVAASSTWREVSRRLGLRAGGRSHQQLQQHVARLGLNTSHLPAMIDGRVRPPRAWTDDDLRDAVRESVSIAGLLRRLGYQPSGGMHRFIKAHIRRLELDTSHFTGQSWAKGRRLSTGFRARPLDEILVANSTYSSSGGLRRRLIREGLKEPRCEICGLDTWRGEPLPLALDHVNGDPTDNRLENLRILCPNCHALTDTWCARKPAAGVPQR